MTKFIQILLLLITVHLPQLKTQQFRLPDEIVLELTRRKIRKKQVQRTRRVEKKNFIHPKYRSTKPRDHRFTDQRKLRRMYRNV